MKTFYRILAGLSFFLFFSCQNESQWYPSADVDIAGSYEYAPAGGGKALSVTLVIHNTSSASIINSVVTVKVVTDAREYLQTAASATRIIPDGKIALTVAIPYLTSGESLATGGVSVYDAFFD
jgi:hypothetical protein